MPESNVAQNPAGNEPAGGQNVPQQQQSTGTGTPSPADKNGQPPQEKVYTYKEDREKWTHPEHLGRVTGRLTQAEQKLKEFEAREKEYQRKLAVLAGGGEQRTPEQDEDEKARQVLNRLYPTLGELTPEDIQELRQLRQEMESVRAARDDHWNRHADTMLTNLHSGFAKALGSESLTDSQKKRVTLAYVQEAQSAAVARERAIKQFEATGYTDYDFENDFLGRHNRGDQKLIEDFIKGFTNDFYEPARRQVVSRVGGRVAVPNGRGRTPTAAGQPQKRDLTNEKNFKDALSEAIDRYSS